MAYPIAGQPYQIEYRVRVADTLTDLPAGSTVNSAILKLNGTTVLTVTGPAVRQSTGYYLFPAATMPAAGDYDVEVNRTVNSLSQVDAGGPLTVYPLDGDVVDNALLAQLETRLGVTLVDPDRARALAALDDITVLAEGVCTLPDPWPSRVTKVVLAAARRAFENPSGYSSETIGDYSYRLASNGGGAYLTDAERRIIRLACRGTDTTVDTSRRLRARLGDAILHERYDDDLVVFNSFGQRI